MQLHASGGFACATSGPVLVQAWADAIRLDELERTQRMGDALGQAFDDRIGIVTIVRSGMKLPAEAVRQQAGENLRRSQHRIVASSTVIPGTGFAASAYRAAHTTLQLFARTAHPSKIHGAIEPACQFVANGLCLGPEDYAALLSVAREVDGAVT